MKNYRIEKSVLNSYQIAVCYSVPKNPKHMPKRIWGYKFKSVELMNDYINKFNMAQLIKEQQKEQEKIKRAQLKKDLINPFKVGDLLYYSWGYDQTNIDFWQVVKVTAKTIDVSRLNQKIIEYTGFMSETVEPIKDSFCGNRIVTKHLQIDKSGKVYITGLWLYDGKPKNQSHYA